MWTCQKCGLPVYFAERRQSLGHDWHPNCLKCEECGKILSPGAHAEVRQTLKACWSLIISFAAQRSSLLPHPLLRRTVRAQVVWTRLYDGESSVTSRLSLPHNHNILSRNFGRRENSFIRDQNILKNKVDDYNVYYNNISKNQISFREVNGRYDALSLNLPCQKLSC